MWMPRSRKKRREFPNIYFLISSRMISSHGFISSSQFSRPMQNLYFYLNVANVIVLWVKKRNVLLGFIKFHYWNLSGYSDLSVEEGIVSRRKRICVKWIVGVAWWTCGAKVKKEEDLEELEYGGGWKGKMRELYNIGRREGEGERSRWKVRTWSRKENERMNEKINKLEVILD